MIIISQNLINYGIPIPDNAVFRVNLAWVSSLEKLEEILEKNKENRIFLDVPKNRLKPPHNRYSIDDLLPVIKKYGNITYFAISNVNSPEDLLSINEKIPKNITIVPKIESPQGVKNIKQITEKLNNEKIVMLDHDDLYTEILKNKESPESFSSYIQELSDFCKENDVILLRTIGVMFADSETRISEYVK